MIIKITPSIMKSLDAIRLELTNQNSVNIIKVLRLQNNFFLNLIQLLLSQKNQKANLLHKKDTSIGSSIECIGGHKSSREIIDLMDKGGHLVGRGVQVHTWGISILQRNKSNIIL